MIIPSIDILGGKAVQLRGGKQPPLDAGDPRALAERYARAGEIAIVDLDAALGRGSNKDLVLELVRKYPARVGGGIRSIELALEYLNAGARKIMIGTAATPEVLARLPRERLIVALDSKDEVLMVEGWTRPAEGTIAAIMKELAPYVSGFLVTFIETEGDLCGIDLERARSLVVAAGTCRVTFAGGATGGARGLQDIVALDAMGADLQIGTALVTGSLDLAEAFAAPLRSDRPDAVSYTHL
ncbi:MAG: HisA/HisF-related TIM barrel protein, partial [Spirochaetaceae bacterium]|nr:HisA/HisF-related TIM barrel protein [Spirochaetaceae bacterium]